MGLFAFSPRILAALAAACLLPVGASAQGVFDSIGQEVSTVMEKSKPSIVRVRARNGSADFYGTGFFIDNKGTLITATIVIELCDQISVEFNGQKYDAQVVGRDLRSGVAVLRIKSGKTPYLNFASSKGLKEASAVITVGYPYDLPSAASFGLVTGFDTQYLKRFFPTTHIRANVPISPGQIGGPMLNSKGEVVGLVVIAIEGGKAIYALPSDALGKVCSDIKAYGSGKHGWVGVGFTESDNGDSHRVKVSELFKDTPASASGMQPGDVVRKIGEREILRPADAMDASFFSKVGEDMTVQVSRDGKLMTFKFPVTERPTHVPITLQAAREPKSTVDTLPPNATTPVGFKGAAAGK